MTVPLYIPILLTILYFVLTWDIAIKYRLVNDELKGDIQSLKEKLDLKEKELKESQKREYDTIKRLHQSVTQKII